MVILVVVGAATVLGVIVAAVIETRRMDREKPSMPQQQVVTPADKKRG
jgi:energy-converting hydrogenase Eha subunit A